MLFSTFALITAQSWTHTNLIWNYRNISHPWGAVSSLYVTLRETNLCFFLCYLLFNISIKWMLKSDVSFNNIILLQIASTDGSIPICNNKVNSNKPLQTPSLTHVVNLLLWHKIVSTWWKPSPKQQTTVATQVLMSTRSLDFTGFGLCSHCQYDSNPLASLLRCSSIHINVICDTS